MRKKAGLAATRLRSLGLDGRVGRARGGGRVLTGPRLRLTERLSAWAMSACPPAQRPPAEWTLQETREGTDSRHLSRRTCRRSLGPGRSPGRHSTGRRQKTQTPQSGRQALRPALSSGLGELGAPLPCKVHRKCAQLTTASAIKRVLLNSNT